MTLPIFFQKQKLILLIIICTMLMMAVTGWFFQHKVEKIDHEIQNLKSNDNE